MTDQAEELGRLMQRAAAGDVLSAGRIRQILVLGGKPGVGASTLAVNLAACLAADALRVVLLDANLTGPSLAAYCGVATALGIGDVLGGRKSIHEALARGPAGMQILAGSPGPETQQLLTERPVQRLLRQIGSLGPHADWLIADGGHQPNQITGRLGRLVERLLIVTSPDAVAVMDTYALVKTLVSRAGLACPLHLVVNEAGDATIAADVHRRIDLSCRRFLGLAIGLAGWLPIEAAAGQAARAGRPLVLSDPTRPLSTALERLARQLVELPPASHVPSRAA